MNMREGHPPLEQPPWKAHKYITVLKPEMDCLRKNWTQLLYLDSIQKCMARCLFSKKKIIIIVVRIVIKLNLD
jgi:hypothetical protein